MKLEISRRARREIERVNRWWVENRDEKDLFVRELAAAEIELRAAPFGEAWRHRGEHVIRRHLLEKTGYHLYYSYEADSQRLLVLAVWGAKRGTAPKL